MHKRLALFMPIALLLVAVTAGEAQTPPEPTRIMWQDDFNDTASDSAGVVNIGWIRFGEPEGLMWSVVDQREDHLYMQEGSFQIIGAVVAQTNGLPFVNPADPQTLKFLLDNNFSDPNQELTFRFNFFNVKSSFFYVATRQTQDDTTGSSFPIADPTERPAYTLLLDPLKKEVGIAKFPEVSFAGLDPSNWTYFAPNATFEFEQDIWYWAKFYLFQGTIRAKVWADGETEPTDWLLEGTDNDPRVTGKFTTFTLIGSPPSGPGVGDIVLIDDVTMRGFGEPTGIQAVSGEVPATFELEQNYPNPFNPETSIQFSLNQPGRTKLAVYTITGQQVRTLVSGQQPAGRYRVTFDGRDDSGRQLPTGFYLYRLESGNQVATRKMLILK